ncbi:MAG TPA: hypothetical protein DCO73_00635 [Alphaproteobacteria bacterium]|nr:hypothetical protein [Alphaproteobacteria bacterium]
MVHAQGTSACGVQMTETESYGRRAIEFVERVRGLSSPDEIAAMTQLEFASFGFSNVSVFDLQHRPGSNGFHMLMNSRPQSYVEQYEEENCAMRDPVLLELRHTLKPYSWSDVKSRRKLSRDEQSVLESGREFDAVEGAVVPIVSTRGPIAVVAPCGREPDISPSALAAIELISIYANNALQRAVVEPRRENRTGKMLSPREREVLQWVAAGKTDDEIAEILTLSATTVATHVNRAMQKLQAFRRPFAVAEAIRLGEIVI